MVRTELGAPHLEIAVFATRPQGAGAHLTLINKGTSAAVAQVMVTGINPAPTASVVRLAGKGLAATDGVTLGGAAVTDRGIWQPGTEEFLPVKAGKVAVPLFAASAALVSLG